MNLPQYNTIKKHLEKVICFLENNLMLANCHMVDYFINNWFEKHMPKDIAREIEYDNKDALELILNCATKDKLPKIDNFIKDCVKLSLYNCSEVCLNLEQFKKILNDLGATDKDSMKLEIFMTEKKSHEVEVLSSISASVAEISNSSHIIDIGDGKGYLSSMLAFQYNLPVLGVDAQTINTKSASKRAEKLGKYWPGIEKSPNKSYPNKEERKFYTNNTLYKQITQYVTEDTDFHALINNMFQENANNVTVVGLHTCGDLASNSLKIYAKNKDIKAICNVSCCYHLITEENNEKMGFPMSEHLLKNGFRLGRAARMLSAQSTDRIFHKKEKPNKIMFYRAILQVVFINYGIDVANKHVGKAKKEYLSFSEYVFAALKKLDVDLKISEAELNIIYESYASREYEMYVFSVIRSMLAPVIESAILLDRLLYLYEQGFEHSFLVQLFDAVISPRCYGIISLKL